MKLMKFDWNGKTVEGFAQKIKDKLWIYRDGKTFVLDQDSTLSRGRKSRKKAEGKASADHISAPMPGKITKILTQTGDKVQLGQALLVMEAMKMEYTLKSEMEGTVDNITVSLGQQVALGELLIQLKEV